MNTAEMNGKEIATIYWPDSDDNNTTVLATGGNVLLQMSATHHGDHDEFWIVEYRKINGDFVEVARHNPRYVETFNWA